MHAQYGIHLYAQRSKKMIEDVVKFAMGVITRRLELYIRNCE